MKLATFVSGDETRVGVVEGDRIVPVTNHPDMLALIEAGPAALARLKTGKPVELRSVRLLAPIPRPPRMRDFLCFELHVRQSRANRHLFGLGTERLDPAKVEIARVWYERPVYYKCNPCSVVGHDAVVHWPAYSRIIDYELEIGLIMGREGKNLSRAAALDHVFGYTVFNDFSARDEQYAEMAGQLGPAKGKDFDTGNAMGPWITTADEIGDPQDLEMTACINGETWSRGNSAAMKHTFADIVAYASLEETIYPGEVLGSGTVGGGCGNELGRFMKDGDLIELEVARIGVLRNRISAPHVREVPPLPIRVL
ncbi:MAG: fumarylacetoacetate hydrolase family protein [Burkholderiales bacterium]|nr:fumarylacetoacetate hydrolase family protein [Burkholderiales bacterium]